MPVMSEPSFSERDVCTKLITPALERAGWDIQSQVREEVSLTAGRVMVRGRLVGRAPPSAPTVSCTSSPICRWP